MSWILGFLSDLIVKMLPWFFSGSTTTTVSRSTGIVSMDDLNDLPGNADLHLPDL